ncbi:MULTISPECIES: glycerol-3-phosphate dehydrogenase/oxidase [unclassified Halomonas]|uniref:glycerol-3-phosphate dehydrogenase/oxidase n=1 Tax=unclassified Halomonas TaxID=2609666 RepID=UPI0006D9D55E|nr:MULTISPECIES: glycerol-3-phosphate dehydrogenase/oxidase [unclassified Halomonas]KPQ21610.1 MAG: anaerobic glycerol-3-phosphate dehydrogenase subunit GlpA [Halomonas sp. HL-93]SBR49182.1 glycerol-3-phosphate dehydrogenase [Halomonas sp. HL-93]SNY95930.1 glycerol-3-phosphate dehydrogenase [Halomonas sp. hl-4]
MKLRNRNIEKLHSEAFDVLIIGGGINGAATAAALSGKGANVALIDRGDFAGSTSMHSSNLVWGGIKYMESKDFALVRKLCKSRNHLIKSYPSTVQEIRFLTTITKGFRHSPRYLWAGTWLYWLMGNGFTKRPRLLSPKKIKQEEPIIDIDGSVGGFEYSDAYLHDNDARFVFNFVRHALNYGAIATNYVESLGAERHGDYWVTKARNVIDGQSFDIRAKVLINAAGPWVDQHNAMTGQKTTHQHLYSKGIHLIVPQLTDSQRVLAFFADDGRLFFVIPMGNRTCIGTTDTHMEHPEVEVTAEDIAFVLENINKRLTLDKPLDQTDIISTRCGVRPLAIKAEEESDRDFLQLSRKHVIDTNKDSAHISIFGGKLTDCLNVGDEIAEAVVQLGIALPDQGFRWYGEPANAVKQQFMDQAKRMNLDAMTAATSSEPLSSRLWRRYAEQAMPMLEKIRQDPAEADILIEGTEYIRCELAHARDHEMITQLEDFLRRRAKVSLVVHHEQLRHSKGLKEACRVLFGEKAEERFEDYFAQHRDTAQPYTPMQKVPS